MIARITCIAAVAFPTQITCAHDIAGFVFAAAVAVARSCVAGAHDIAGGIVTAAVTSAR